MGTIKKTRTEWLALVEAWVESGERQADYCRSRGLSLAAFRYWRSQHLREQEAEGSFVALSPEGAPGVVSLQLGGLRVELRADADFVADLLLKLWARC
jgi:hypothetical protein